MIEIYLLEVSGWSAAISGMRNPWNSWANSDSAWGIPPPAASQAAVPDR